jgi:integrase
LPGRGWSEQFDTIVSAEAAAEGSQDTGSTVSANPDDANRTLIRSAIDTFLARKEGKRNVSSVEAYTYILNEFFDYLPRHVRFIDQINGDVLESFFRFLKKAGAAPKTIQNKILVVCFMLKSAGVREPSKMIELPKLEEEPVEPYSTESLKTLFTEMNLEEATRYRFFLDTACREAEVAHAQWSDIDWKKSECIVRSKTWKNTNGLTKSFTTKNHKSRRVPLTRELVGLLRERHKKDPSGVWIFSNEGGTPEGHFLRKFKKIAFRSGLNCGRCSKTLVKGQYENKKTVEVSCKTDAEACEKHYLHRLRKTRATFWHQNGVSLRTIQYWLSHESLETTMKYLGIEDSAKLQTEINMPMY